MLALVLYFLGIGLGVIAMVVAWPDQHIKWWQYWITLFWPIAVPLIIGFYFWADYQIHKEKAK